MSCNACGDPGAVGGAELGPRLRAAAHAARDRVLALPSDRRRGEGWVGKFGPVCRECDRMHLVDGIGVCGDPSTMGDELEDRICWAMLRTLGIECPEGKWANLTSGGEVLSVNPNAPARGDAPPD